MDGELEEQTGMKMAMHQIVSVCSNLSIVLRLWTEGEIGQTNMKMQIYQRSIVCKPRILNDLHKETAYQKNFYACNWKRIE